MMFHGADFTLGLNVTHLLIMAAILERWWRLNRKLNSMLIEHEMLVDLLCSLTGIKREDLPTRHKNGGLI